MNIPRPERWRELSPLLDELLDLEASARQARLDALSVGSPELADELAALLAHDSQARSGAFLTGTAAAAPGSGADASLAGQRLGAYVLQAPLGQGRLQARQFIQALADVAEQLGLRALFGVFGVQRGDFQTAAALLRLALAHAADHQAAHGTRGVGHEVAFAGEGQRVALRNVEVGLVQQRGGAERGIRAQPRGFAPRHAMQLPVQGAEEPVGRAGLALLGKRHQCTQVDRQVVRHGRDSDVSGVARVAGPPRQPRQSAAALRYE